MGSAPLLVATTQRLAPSGDEFFCIESIHGPLLRRRWRRKIHQAHARPKNARTISQTAQSLSLFTQPPRRNAKEDHTDQHKAMRSPLRQVSLRAL